MLAAVCFNAADEMAATAFRRVMMIAMIEGHGGCGSIY
jgi:hypothetical protein